MLTDDQRLELGMRYVNSAYTIGTSTKVATAQRNWSYLKECGVVVNYSLNDPDIKLTALRIIHPSRQISGSTRCVAIVPLIHDDDKLLTTLRTFLRIDDRWAAAYIQSQHFILLKTWRPIGELERGTQLLHEAGHALAAYREKRMLSLDITPPLTEVPEEAEQHYMEAQIWKEWGGQPYQDILDRAVYHVGKSLKGRVIYHSLPRYDPWLVVLNSFLGETTDEDVLNGRVATFSVCVHFEYYERNARKLPGTVQQCRMEAMKAIHKNIWDLRAARRSLKS